MAMEAKGAEPDLVDGGGGRRGNRACKRTSVLPASQDQRKLVHVAQGISPFPQDLLVMLHVMFEHADCMLIALCMLI